MIDYIEGILLSKEESSVVLVVQGGVGFHIHVPQAVAHDAVPGCRLALFTHLIVRQEILALYGFPAEEERSIFILLLGVNGIGPRLALAIVSALSSDSIKSAILNEQPEVFCRVPGVGKTSAQKIQLYLKNKIKGSLQAGSRPITDNDTEVLGALTTLGYSVVEAQAAIQSLPKGAPEDAEARILLALRYFSKN